jgi:aspartyl-tRNA(Asn)/glutamyl-tRNA(Gln) amidotransferase subunit C
MPVSLDDVRHVAALARLGLSDARAASLVSELNAILGHMEVLSKVKTDKLEAVIGIGADSTPLEADAGPKISLVREPNDFAPSMRDGFLLVPRLSTHETTEES